MIYREDDAAIEELLQQLRGMLQMDPMDWDGRGESEDEESDEDEENANGSLFNLSREILGSQATIKELFLFREFCQQHGEEESVIDLDGFIQEALYQHMNTPAFVTTLQYTIAIIISLSSSSLSSSSSSLSYSMEIEQRVGTLLEGIISKILSRPFQATKARLVSLGGLLDILEEVGIVSEEQLNQYMIHIQTLAQRERLPIWNDHSSQDLHGYVCHFHVDDVISSHQPSNPVNDNNNNNDNNNDNSLVKTILKQFNFDEQSYTNTEQAQAIFTSLTSFSLFPPTLITSIRLKEFILPLINLWLRANPDHPDQQTTVIALLSRILIILFAKCTKCANIAETGETGETGEPTSESEEWRETFGVFQQAVALFQGVLRKTKHSLHLCMLLFVSKQCYEMVQGEQSQSLVLLSVVQNMVLFCMEGLTAMFPSECTQFFAQPIVGDDDS